MKKLEEQLQLLPAAEVTLRASRISEIMRQAGVDGLLLCDNANIYYLTGRVFCGFVYVDADGGISCFVRRPSTLHGAGIHFISRPEEIAAHIAAPSAPAFELDTMPYSRVERMRSIFSASSAPANASAIMRWARAVKTPLEIRKMEESGVRQTEVYVGIPHLYQEGMTDMELQIEIERSLRLHGCLGQFRVTGPDLELHMGNVLTGDNADTPSPYDFAMGGAGIDPSLPVGADGTLIVPGKPVMVDVNGNFTGYMTDMTRCYVVGEPSEDASRALRLSCDICARIASLAVPGAAARDLYNEALSMATNAGMADCFMGHRYHAGFVGHGLGISVNEAPVLAPRSRDILVAGNAIAVEPKFVIPGIGAVGIENTYIVEENGPARQITNAPEDFIHLA